MANVYDIKRFTDPDDIKYLAALGIYSKHTLPPIRTETNEISYWLKHYNKKFEDRLYIFGFYVNRIVAGFAELVYFKKEKLIVVDYLTLHPDYRGHNRFWEFIEQIRNYIDNEKIEYDYIVTEIAHLNHEKEPSKRSRTLLRLLKGANFGGIQADYYQPRLSIRNHESRMKAILMISSKSELKQITKATYLAIVETIYFKHYLRWDNEFAEKIDESKKEIEALYKKIKLSISKQLFIKINGYNYDLFDVPVQSPDTPINWKHLILSLGVILTLISLMILASVNYGISSLTIVLFFGLSMITLFALLAAFSKNSRTAMIILDKLLRMFKQFSGKLK
jgi:hypothetical protein